MSKYEFRVLIGGEAKTFSEDDLAEFANSVHLNRLAPGRFSWNFVLQLYVNAQDHQVDPSAIVRELEALESGIQLSTKPATQFIKEPLKGLWHKHYFSHHSTIQNIENQHRGGRLEKLVEKVFDPNKHATITSELINEFSYAVTEGAFEAREANNALTGEWIVFAKHCGQNYYLSLATHDAGDQAIYDQIKSNCFPQFPFLQAPLASN